MKLAVSHGGHSKRKQTWKNYLVDDDWNTNFPRVKEHGVNTCEMLYSWRVSKSFSPLKVSAF